MDEDEKLSGGLCIVSIILFIIGGIVALLGNPEYGWSVIGVGGLFVGLCIYVMVRSSVE